MDIKEWVAEQVAEATPMDEAVEEDVEEVCIPLEGVEEVHNSMIKLEVFILELTTMEEEEEAVVVAAVAAEVA